MGSLDGQVGRKGGCCMHCSNRGECDAVCCQVDSVGGDVGRVLNDLTLVGGAQVWLAAVFSQSNH